jgi:hypothetical protein
VGSESTAVDFFAVADLPDLQMHESIRIRNSRLPQQQGYHVLSTNYYMSTCAQPSRDIA